MQVGTWCQGANDFCQKVDISNNGLAKETQQRHVRRGGRQRHLMGRGKVGNREGWHENP